MAACENLHACWQRGVELCQTDSYKCYDTAQPGKREVKLMGARPGFEQWTSHTPSENQTPRPKPDGNWFKDEKFDLLWQGIKINKILTKRGYSKMPKNGLQLLKQNK